MWGRLLCLTSIEKPRDRQRYQSLYQGFFELGAVAHGGGAVLAPSTNPSIEHASRLLHDHRGRDRAGSRRPLVVEAVALRDGADAGVEARLRLGDREERRRGRRVRGRAPVGDDAELLEHELEELDQHGALRVHGVGEDGRAGRQRREREAARPEEERTRHPPGGADGGLGVDATLVGHPLEYERDDLACRRDLVVAAAHAPSSLNQRTAATMSS
jgi:hypothetical protein